MWEQFMQASYLLSEQAQNQAYRVEIHETVTSTNQIGLDRAREGDKGKLWIVAQEQTQGVGRRGRFWHSPPGNLYASLLLVADYAPNEVALLGFVAGVAVAETLGHLLGKAAKIQLKWPNDVLLNGAKLTGILVERHPLGPVKSAIMIGLGINVVHVPKQTDYAVTSLQSSGYATTPAQIFSGLSHFWAMNFNLWEEGGGFERIRKKWLEFAVGLGEEIHIEQQGRRLSGIFKTIDEAGQLVIEQIEGRRAIISAGDVHFGDVATWRPEKHKGLDRG